MAVTNNIKEIREQRGIYQDDLAAAIGYSTKTVGRIERGDSTPSAEFMLRISKYFNMPECDRPRWPRRIPTSRIG